MPFFPFSTGLLTADTILRVKTSYRPFSQNWKCTRVSFARSTTFGIVYGTLRSTVTFLGFVKSGMLHNITNGCILLLQDKGFLVFHLCIQPSPPFKWFNRQWPGRIQSYRYCIVSVNTDDIAETFIQEPGWLFLFVLIQAQSSDYMKCQEMSTYENFEVVSRFVARHQLASSSR